MFASKMRRMALPKFIFNDETKKNSHGFFLLNGGGKFERFQEYSPMLDNHDLNRLIGRWDNLHVEGALLVADPVFDDGITLGAERKGQVERGFLRGASPGIVILRAEYRTNPAGGEDLYVTEWELFEGSVTSVPSNAGAVTLKIYTGDGHLVEDGDVRLHVDNIVKLCAESSPQGRKPNIKPMEKITLSAEAYVALGINQDADATAMSKAIVQLAADRNKHKETADALQKEIDAARKKRAEDMVNLAVEQGRIGAPAREKYVELAMKRLRPGVGNPSAIPAKCFAGGFRHQDRRERDSGRSPELDAPALAGRRTPRALRRSKPRIPRFSRPSGKSTTNQNQTDMPIEKELWVDIIKEQPIQEGDFLNESEDLSALVDNNTLHLAEAGVEPEVFIDNDTYPVGIVQREDVPEGHPAAYPRHEEHRRAQHRADAGRLRQDAECDARSCERPHAQAPGNGRLQLVSAAER